MLKGSRAAAVSEAAAAPSGVSFPPSLIDDQVKIQRKLSAEASSLAPGRARASSGRLFEGQRAGALEAKDEDLSDQGQGVLGSFFKHRPELEDAAMEEDEDDAQVPSPKVRKQRTRKLIIWGLIVLMTIVGAGIALKYLGPRLRPERPPSAVVIVDKAPYKLELDASANIRKLDDAQQVQKLFELVGHEDAVRSVSVRADGKVLVSVGKDGSWMLWDLEKGEGFTPKDYPGEARAAYFAGGGKKLILLDQDGTVRAMDLKSGEVETITLDIGTLKGHAFSPDGQRVALVAKIYENGKPRTKLYTIDLGTKETAAFAADGKVLALGTTDRGELLLTSKKGLAKLYLIEPGKPPEVKLDKYMPGIKIIGNAASRDGRIIYLAAEMAGDEAVIAWPFAAGAESFQVINYKEFGFDPEIAGIDATADGKTAAVLMTDGSLWLWTPGPDKDNPTKPVKIGDSDSGVRVFFSQDGKNLYTTDEDGDIFIWSVPR